VWYRSSVAWTRESAGQRDVFAVGRWPCQGQEPPTESSQGAQAAAATRRKTLCGRPLIRARLRRSGFDGRNIGDGGETEARSRPQGWNAPPAKPVDYWEWLHSGAANSHRQ